MTMLLVHVLSSLFSGSAIIYKTTSELHPPPFMDMVTLIFNFLIQQDKWTKSFKLKQYIFIQRNSSLKVLCEIK